MQVREIMTENPVCCTPDTNLQEVARLMMENDCGLIPVVDNQENRKPLGTITDRDITVRTVAAGQNPADIKASNIMSMSVATVKPETSVQECCDEMEDRKIRRILVVDENGRCCGIVAQADVAEHGSANLVSDMVEEISEAEHSPNTGRFNRTKRNRSYSTEKSSFRTERAPITGSVTKQNVLRTETPRRFRTERTPAKKSSFGLKSLLPLLAGVGAGAAIKYFLVPENKTETRKLSSIETSDTSFETETMPVSTITTRDLPETKVVETKEVITSKVSASAPKDQLKVDIDLTDKGESDADKKFGRAAS